MLPFVLSTVSYRNFESFREPQLGQGFLTFLGRDPHYRGADKSLARPGREKNYSDQTLIFASH